MKKRQDKPSQGTKERILQAALDEFADRGLDGARVDRIAELASANKAMIYYHFDSKDKLYASVLEQILSRVGNDLVEATQQVDEIETFLHRMTDVYHRIFREQPQYRAIIMRELTVPDEQALARIGDMLLGTGFPGRFRERLQAEIQSGRFREVDPRHAAVSFITLIIGFHMSLPLVTQVLKISDPDRFAEERKRIMVDHYLNGLKAGRS